MTPSRLIRRYMTRAVLPALCLAGTAYFGHHALLDEHGLSSLHRLTAEVATRQAVLEGRERERDVREAQVRALSSASLDPDMLDERARGALGLSRPDEVIIFKPAPQADPGQAPVAK